MRSFNHSMKAIQIFRDPVQFPRGAGECLRDRIHEHPLDRHHLHFLRALVDNPSEDAKLQDQAGTVDFENFMLIQPRIENFRKNYTLSSIPRFAWF